MNGVGPTHAPLNNGSFQGTSGTTGATAFAANVGATTLLAAGHPAGVYRADISLQASVLATLAATVALNMLGTDSVGAFTQVVPLGTVLNFNLAALARVSGSLVFESTGAAAIQFSITGITTPGPLAAKYFITLTRVG